MPSEKVELVAAGLFWSGIDFKLKSWENKDKHLASRENGGVVQMEIKTSHPLYLPADSSKDSGCHPRRGSEFIRALDPSYLIPHGFTHGPQPCDAFYCPCFRWAPTVIGDQYTLAHLFSLRGAICSIWPAWPSDWLLAVLLSWLRTGFLLPYLYWSLYL